MFGLTVPSVKIGSCSDDSPNSNQIARSTKIIMNPLMKLKNRYANVSGIFRENIRLKSEALKSAIHVHEF